MHFLLVDQIGKVTGRLDTNDLALVPTNAIQADTLSEWQRCNPNFLTWTGTAWTVDAALPVQPATETGALKLTRLKAFLQANGFTATQSNTLMVVLKELLAQLN